MGLLVKIGALCVVVFLAYNYGRDGARVDQLRIARIERMQTNHEARLQRLEQPKQATAPTATPAANK